VPLTKQELWRAIPECHNPVCIAIGLVVLFYGKSPCKAKVSQFQYPSLRDQYVGGLHIPMEDLVVVDVVEALKDLLHHLLNLGQGELHTDIAEQARQVVLAEVKDQVEGGFVSVVGPADLNQVDYVFVVELLKNTNFPEGSDGEAFLLILHQDSLQRYNFLWVGFASCLKHLTKSTLPNLSHLFILVCLLGAVGEGILL